MEDFIKTILEQDELVSDFDFNNMLLSNDQSEIEINRSYSDINRRDSIYS